MEIKPGGPRPPQETTESPLPVERMPKPSSRRVAIIAATTLLIVVAMNFAAGVYLHGNTPNEGYLRIQRKWDMLATMQQPRGSRGACLIDVPPYHPAAVACARQCDVEQA